MVVLIDGADLAVFLQFKFRREASEGFASAFLACCGYFVACSKLQSMIVKRVGDVLGVSIYRVQEWAPSACDHLGVVQSQI